MRRHNLKPMLGSRITFTVKLERLSRVEGVRSVLGKELRDEADELLTTHAWMRYDPRRVPGIAGGLGKKCRVEGVVKLYYSMTGLECYSFEIVKFLETV